MIIVSPLLIIASCGGHPGAEPPQSGETWKQQPFGLLFSCFVAGVGHDPTTSGLWIRRSSQLSYPAIIDFFTKNALFRHLKKPCVFHYVEIEGFEPSLTEPESVVLPLHHISIYISAFADCKCTVFSEKCKNYWTEFNIFETHVLIFLW